MSLTNRRVPPSFLVRKSPSVLSAPSQVAFVRDAAAGFAWRSPARRPAPPHADHASGVPSAGVVGWSRYARGEPESCAAPAAGRSQRHVADAYRDLGNFPGSTTAGK